MPPDIEAALRTLIDTLREHGAVQAADRIAEASGLDHPTLACPS